MDLRLYKTLWGHCISIEQACEQAIEHGFDGLEGQAISAYWKVNQLKQALQASHLDFIAEITTAGSYVPDRSATLEQHLHSFKQQLEIALELSPIFVTCLGGCDAWENSKSVDFFASAIELANDFNIEVSFETHRGRSLFNPFDARRICECLPELKLTCDFSHWCVVCERLLDTDAENLDFFFRRAKHIHARVGFDQGPQVFNPSAVLYQRELAQHLSWWQAIWSEQLQQGFEYSTVTPEFGDDGYQIRDEHSGETLGDIWQNNCWMAETLKKTFNQSQVYAESLHA